ncbi:MAG: flagellar basal body P-ring formation protein FlgA [Xanthomonadaceae bacterium]|nr:flagellar basal body P-ring formation protein FlgA [Xanthomonadaceae bacterium]MDE1963811.1 flagellar basal body P-ring formation protein FlgA [Xanthomonadaceae bacterium]
MNDCLRRLAGLLLALATLPAWAGGDPVSAFASQWLRQQYAAPGSRVVTQAAAIDPRLALADCRGMMVASLPPNLPPRPRMSVLVHCTTGSGWSIRVPVALQVFRDVLVTTRALQRGDGVQPGDVRAESRDITRLGYGYVDRLDQVAGRTLARPLPPGSVLTPSALGGRDLVRAGDRVAVVADIGGIEVRAGGVALGSGDNGARLRVRNESSGRVIDAMVRGPGEVLALP